MAEVVGSYQMAMFIPMSWSVTGGPMLDWLTVTEVSTVTVTGCVIALPLAGVTVRV